MVRSLSKETLQADLKEALKGGDGLRVSTLRFLMAAIKNREIEIGKPLDLAELTLVVKSNIKKRLESIESFTQGGRPELADQERKEMAILQEYLPPSLGEAEIQAMVEEAIRETGASGPRDIGAVMKLVMQKAAGRADGRLLNQLVKSKLS